MHGCLDVIIPVFTDGSTIADFAIDTVGFYTGETCDDTWFPLSATAVAI
jgi:hypothetical protein